MKKLLYSGLMALMMLFAMPGIVRAEGEGEGETTTSPYEFHFLDLMGEALSTEEDNTIALYMPIAVMGSDAEHTPLAPMFYNTDIYYVLLAEGETTEPTRENFQAEGNTKVKKALFAADMYSYYIYVDDATAKTLKVKVYVSPAEGEENPEGPGLLSEEAEEEFVSEIYTFPIAIATQKATTPVLNPASGEVEVGATITVTVDGYNAEDDVIMYSLTGATPLYVYNNVDPTGDVKECFNGNITITAAAGEEVTLKVIYYGLGNDGMLSSEVVTATYTVAAAEEPEEPVLTVTPASNGTTEGEGLEAVTTFNGVAAFNMSVTARPASDHDSMYKIKAELWTKADYEDYDNGKPITTDWLDVTDTHMEYVDAYNGDYVVVFTLQYKRNSLAEFITVGDEYEIHFTVTNNEEPLPPVDPTLNVTAGSNGTTGADGKVTFDGPAKFTMAVSGVAEGDALSNYTISAAIYHSGDYAPFTTVSFDATDTEAELLGVYNGDYEVEFYLTRGASGDHGMPEDLESTKNLFLFAVTNYAEIELEDPDFTVASASNGTVADNKVTFNGPAAFTMTVGEMTEGDSLKISAELWTKADYEDYDNGKAITTYSYEATDTEAEFLGVYNGEYVVVFSLDRYALLNRDFSSIKDTTIHFTVTEYPEPEVVDPTFAVASASNGTVAEGVVTFDGAAKFTMTVGEMTEGDSLKISAEIWTKADYEDMLNGKALTMNSYEATDTEAEFLGVYNGEYVVVFSLDRYNLMMRDFSSVRDTTIRFTVTNYEEIIDNYTVAIKPVGATMTADTAAYAGNVVFDILVGGLQVADSNMTIATTIYTLAQYDTMGDAEPTSTVKAADSVRFDARISDGAYVAVVELKRAGDREEMVVESAILYLTVGGVAVERNTELAGVNVYPNPSNGTFNVAVPEKARIDIFGLNGAKVMSREANAGVETFSINHSGIYFVRVMAGNKAAVKRVVVR